MTSVSDDAPRDVATELATKLTNAITKYTSEMVRHAVARTVPVDGGHAVRQERVADAALGLHGALQEVFVALGASDGQRVWTGPVDGAAAVDGECPSCALPVVNGNPICDCAMTPAESAAAMKEWAAQVDATPLEKVTTIAAPLIEGDVIRYGNGPTALMRITTISPNHGGSGMRRYYGRHFYGGGVGAYEDTCRRASAEEKKRYEDEEIMRGHLP